MQSNRIFLIVCIILLAGLAVPVTEAMTPLWVEQGTVGGELGGVVISSDGSTIITGGDQLISLTRDGRKRWSGWSGSALDVSSQGDYILASRGTTLRLISGGGKLVWDQNMDIAVNQLAIAPDFSVVAASGGGKVRILTFSGEGVAANSTMTINHLRILPPDNKILVTTNTGVLMLDNDLMPDWHDAGSGQKLLAIAPDGSTFVTATTSRVRMYFSNGSLAWDRRYDLGDVQALAYSRDGSTIVLGTDEHNIVAIHQNGAPMWTANATDWITSVAVSDDGNTIAAGSLDKKLYVFNRAGTSLGTFTTRTAIKSDSVAVTGDGQLVVIVDQTAVYAFSRSSLAGTETTRTIAETGTPTTEVTSVTIPVAATSRVTTRPTTFPTPFPMDTGTRESPLSPAILPASLLILFLCRNRR